MNYWTKWETYIYAIGSNYFVAKSCQIKFRVVDAVGRKTILQYVTYSMEVKNVNTYPFQLNYY